MTISADTPVGRIAAEHPDAARVFERHGIDYCCGGDSQLGEACAQKGVDAGVALAEIQHVIDTVEAPEASWDEAPLADLIDHIVATYHRSLDEELPRLMALMEKVGSVHGEKNPEMFAELSRVYLGLKDELEHHMMKEEGILFPMIKNDQGAMGGGPISCMMHEHDSAGAALTRIRALTDDYMVPEEACNSWTALWHGLEKLEGDLHTHIHLENNILFPRALRG
jgi:regulator of cell morphogenesis and NO signaling